jgi:hypothetical protein
VKLHGTNAAVRITDDGTVVAQSRNRDITVEDDNCGFAAWVSEREDTFKNYPSGMTIFGEWAGKGIQKVDAVTQVDRKFHIFAIHKDDKIFYSPAAIYHTLRSDLPSDTEVIPVSYILPFDFSDEGQVKSSLDIVNNIVESIGKVDPYIKDRFGVEGPGEGLVLAPATEDRDTWSRFAFKAKCENHQVKKSSKGAASFSETPENANAFVEMFVTNARCEQALWEACDNTAEKSKIPDFLRWVGGDVKKESACELEEMGLEWKKVSGLVNKAAAKWFIQKCEEI